MAATLLAPPDALVATSEERAAFEEHRRPANLVELAQIVESEYALRDIDWNALFAYLLRHPAVLDVLREARREIQDVFGHVRPTLDLVIDPDEGWDELFIVIPTPDTPRVALDRLALLDRRWFNDAVRRAEFAINITVEPNV